MLNQKIRYQSIIQTINSILEKNPKAKICEIGSGTQGIGKYLPKIKFTGVDKYFDDYSGIQKTKIKNMIPVKADAIKLPFEKNTFDLVFSKDMMEHLNPKDRVVALKEMIRISKNQVEVSFPCGIFAKKSDQRYAKLINKCKMVMPGWLKEHMAIPFPKEKEFDEILKKLGYSYSFFFEESITLHEIITLIEFITFGIDVVEKLIPRSILKILASRGNHFYRKSYVIKK